ncbi:LssY C-terminal domain-containing protein [Quadrisphaera sp. KR29]|uniref:LssY C-terminal domain-containing protein n=1 Tax=Quadrisphaera sp. KR29 TaxID=3461391 RepID=UPI004044A19C
MSRTPGRRRTRTAALLALVDGGFTLLGAAAAGWLALLTVQRIASGGLRDWWLVAVLWLLLAYLLLPRLHGLLTRVYVPDYFIGRTRTYEGLLGDPVNAAVLGTTEDLHSAMTRGGWQLADELGFRSGLRTVTSTLARRTYATAPVSPLFLFGRSQDLTYQQEVQGSPARRHHVRFWRTPPGWRLPGGARVDWVAAGTYDRRVGLSAFTLQVTHKIDVDTDAERDHLVATVLAGSPEARVRTLRHFSSGYHSRNGGGDAIRTDGHLPVLDLADVVDEERADPGVPPPDWHGLAAPALALLAAVRDTGASNRDHRPLSLYLGHLLVVLRLLLTAAVGAAGAAAEVIGPERAAPWLPQPAELVPWQSAPAPPLVLLGGAVAAWLAVAAASQLAFAGSSAARLLVLVAALGDVVVLLTATTAGGGGLVPLAATTALVLDLGVLVTLSAGDARDFTLRTRLRTRLRTPGRRPRTPGGAPGGAPEGASGQA